MVAVSRVAAFTAWSILTIKIILHKLTTLVVVTHEIQAAFLGDFKVGLSLKPKIHCVVLAPPAFDFTDLNEVFFLIVGQ